MKISLFTFLALFMSGSLLAQTSSSEAKALLTNASEKMRSYDNYYIEFTYTFENSRVDPPVVQTEEGNIAVKGDDFRLNFLGTEQIRNGDKLYTILKDDEEVQVTQYEEGENEGLTPSRILDIYRKGFSYKYGGSEKSNGKTIEYVILKPTASEEIDKIMVGIEKGTGHVVSLKQWGTNGTITTFDITSFVPNKDFPQGHFRFNRQNYDGYYIAE